MAGFINPHLETGCPRNPRSSIFILVMCSLVNISGAVLGDENRTDDLAPLQSGDHFS